MMAATITGPQVLCYNPRMAKKTTLNELGAMMEHVVKHMATKEEIADIRKEMATKEEMTAGFATIRREMATKDDIAAIKSDLRDIKARFKEVESAVKDHAGHSKEIDHAL